MKKKILFVTFPVDLGNRTLEVNLMKMFSDKMNFFRFAAEHSDLKDKVKITFIKSVWYRLKSSLKLRRKVKMASRNGDFILFQNLSPALFSFGAWNNTKGIVVLDWTRSLRPSIYGSKIKKDIVFYAHRMVLKKCYKIFCWTDASIENIHSVYGIEMSKIHKVPAPFLIDDLSIFPRKTPILPRVLFIGGDWKRKGGDILQDAWQNRLESKCKLTILTSNKSLKIEGVEILTNISYGTPEHKKIFEQNDILILPARFDAYPQVIGEAAAGGLAVVTTKFALGSPEIILHGKSGYIAESPEESIDYLLELLDNPYKIDEFKKEGYLFMQKKFSMESIRQEYFKVIES